MTSGEWLIQAHVCRPPMTQNGRLPFGSRGDLWKCQCGQHWMVIEYPYRSAIFWDEVTSAAAEEAVAQHVAGRRPR